MGEDVKEAFLGSIRGAGGAGIGSYSFSKQKTMRLA